MPKIKGIEIGKLSQDGRPGIEKFFDILEEVNKEEQTTIETLLALSKVAKSEQSREATEQKD